MIPPLAWWLARLGRLSAGQGRWRLAGRWMVVAALFSFQILCALRWVPMADAFAQLGTGFFGRLIGGSLPLFLAGSLALSAVAILHPEFESARWAVSLILLVLWGGSAGLAQWRLRSVWGFGPPDLSAAAGVEASFEEVSVAVLSPSGVRVEKRLLEVQGFDVSPETLRKVFVYLRSRNFKSIFSRRAITVLRRGWLDQWDSQRALEAASLQAPGVFAADYVTALSLIRAGPLTPERFLYLDELHEMARASSAGFEDINGSQLTFEAFSAAFSRFNDESRARYWLGRVDNLWPVNEKKIEVTPLERLRQGSIIGRLLVDGQPAADVRVGLFLELFSEVTKKASVILSSSVFPDQRGNFFFNDLGKGSYHLELMGPPDVLQGDIAGSPGLITISESSPTVRLAEIRISGR